MAQYKELCKICKTERVLIKSRKQFPICIKCQMKNFDQEIKDPKFKKLFDIPKEDYINNSFLRDIKSRYLRFGNLSEKQIEVFKKVVENENEKIINKQKEEENPGYTLPFPKFIKKVIHKPTGIYANENFLESKYAKDFILNTDTKILAARSGEIIKIKSNSDEWGLNIKLTKKANYVLIDHHDGTYAEYLHFGKDKITTKKGRKVTREELLGYSGLSGCMDKPFLHFNVFKIVNEKAISIPIKFLDD